MSKKLFAVLYVLLFAMHAVANAAPRTFDFSVELFSGNFVGKELTGTISFNDSVVPRGVGVSQTGLLSDLGFRYNNILYTEQTANTGYLLLNGDRSLNSLSFGTHCWAGGCSAGDPGQWFLILGGSPANDFQFAGYREVNEFGYSSFIERNPTIDPTLKTWASKAQDLFKRTGSWLTFFGDVASWYEGKFLKDVALKRILMYTAGKIAEWSTDNINDDIILKSYKQIELVMKLLDYGTAPGSATVAAAKVMNNTVIFGLGEIIEDPPRSDFDEVQTLAPAFDTVGWDAISTDETLSQGFLDMLSCSADMADGTYAMLLAAERAWGASLDNAVDALALQGAAYVEAASKANIALARCSQAAQNLTGFEPDPQAVMAVAEMGWDLVNEEDIDALRHFFLSTGLVDAALIDQAFAAAYEDDALFLNPAELEDLQNIAARFAALGPAPSALREAQVPEPTALALVLLALGLLLFARRASRRSNPAR